MADGEGRAGGVGPRKAWVRYDDQLGEAICERVAAGESLSRLEREPGMPTRTAVKYWVRKRADFADRLAAAQRRARTVQRAADREAEAMRLARPRQRDGGRVSAYTPELGAAICRRLADGESLIAIARDPQMPCAATVYRWVQRHADFQEMYVEARQMQADYLFDEAREVGLAATPHTVWVGRLQFDIIRWQTARLAPRKYVEKLVVEAVKAADAEEAAEAAEAETPRYRQVIVCDFFKGPNGKVLCDPPRNEREEQEWVEAYGKPYDPDKMDRGKIQRIER